MIFLKKKINVNGEIVFCFLFYIVIKVVINKVWLVLIRYKNAVNNCAFLVMKIPFECATSISINPFAT